MLKQLADGLWVVKHPFKTMGLQLGTRSTLVRLDDGGLALISPGPLSVRVAPEISRVGPVRAIVAPNLLHHLYLERAVGVHPEAKVLVAPGLKDKLARMRRDVRVDEELGHGPARLLGTALEHTWVQGCPSVNEMAFLHRPSRTLILTDVLFNVPRPEHWYTRLAMTVNGGYGRLLSTRVFRTTIKDRAAFRRSIEALLAWDFDRVIVTHGDVVERGGYEALREAFAWLGVSASQAPRA